MMHYHHFTISRWFMRQVAVISATLLALALGGLSPAVAMVGHAAPTVSMSATPTVVAPGQRINLSASGFRHGELVILFWDGRRLSGTDQATRSGSLSGAYAYAPIDSFTGRHILLAVGSESRRLGSVSILVPAPSLQTRSSQLQPGDNLDVRGAGFGVGEPISLYWDSVPLAGPQVIVDQQGDFRDTSAFVPRNAAGGQHVLMARGQRTGRTATASISIAGGWIAEPSGIASRLHAVACPDQATCVAVGDDGAIVGTTNGGLSWTRQASGTRKWLFGVSCTNPSVCFAVGGSGTIIATTNGGVSWTRQSSGTSQSLWSITCSAFNACLAVGDAGTVVTTTNGGATWSVHGSGTTASLRSVSCPGNSKCYSVGTGPIIVSTDGGATWTQRAANPHALMYGIACGDINTCTAVGTKGRILVTNDGGNTWTVQLPHTGNYLWGVACNGTRNCTAVGGNGWILSTVDGGLTWLRQSSGTVLNLRGVACPSTGVCIAVGDGGTIRRLG